MRILVVDDDDGIREGLVRFLRLAGHEVGSAEHGGRALALLGDGPLPDLILLDLSMPVMNGVEFRRAQLADPRLRAIPTVVLTGDPFVPPGLEARVLRKPVDGRQILRILESEPSPLSIR